MEEGSGSNDHIDHPKAFFIFHNIRHVLPDYWVGNFRNYRVLEEEIDQYVKGKTMLMDMVFNAIEEIVKHRKMYQFHENGRNFVVKCDKCQRIGNLSRHDELPQKSILELEHFDVWGINLMGHFPQSGTHLYILLAIDYVSKWVEAISCVMNDTIIVSKFLKKNIFTRFGILRVIISNERSHFVNHIITKLLAKYNITHKKATTYHPQTNGQAEVSNWEIKKILEKVVNHSYKDWADHLDSTL
ncbi:hypothetical protein Csa_018494 [Cucumis sativus]|nr:hypothetical protein Csa_018494 [Cucumis sativus]